MDSFKSGLLKQNWEGVYKDKDVDKAYETCLKAQKKLKKRNPHSATPPVQVGISLVEGR